LANLCNFLSKKSFFQVNPTPIVSQCGLTIHVFILNCECNIEYKTHADA